MDLLPPSPRQKNFKKAWIFRGSVWHGRKCFRSTTFPGPMSRAEQGLLSLDCGVRGIGVIYKIPLSSNISGIWEDKVSSPLKTGEIMPNPRVLGAAARPSLGEET